MSDYIEQELYDKIRFIVPLPCVDLFIMLGQDIMLCLRKNEPEKGRWFTPGGRINYGESALDAAMRILYKETGISIESVERVEELITDDYFGKINEREVHNRTTLYKIELFLGRLNIKLDPQHSQYGFYPKEYWLDNYDIHPLLKTGFRYI